MTQASNLVSLKIAQEQSIGVLPGSPVWYVREPQSYSQFGGQTSKVSRKFMSSDRQNRKGTIVDIDVQGGWQEDFTFSNLTALLQGFFFADAREKAQTIPLNGSAVEITSVTTDYNATSGLSIFAVNDLILASGFGVPANNGFKLVTAADVNSVTTDGLVAEATPPATARLVKVGKQFPSGDVSIDVTDGIVTMVSAGENFDENWLPGEWLIVGGQTAPTLFATCPRFRGRLRSVEAGLVEFDDVIVEGGAALVTDAGATRTLHIFIGGVIRSEPDYADYVRRTYTIERTLGDGPTAVQAEYVRGAVPSAITLNLPGQDKLTADMVFIGLESNFKSGEPGFEIESDGAEVVAGLNEDPFNTSSDLKFSKLAVLDPEGSSQPRLFTFATECTINVDNGVEASKALGVTGGFDAKPDNFTVTGNVNAYFETVDTLEAIRENEDVSLTFGLFQKNRQQGFIVDMPLIQLSGFPTVAMDDDIMVPLDIEAVMSKFGHTMLYNYFPYVPLWAAS